MVTNPFIISEKIEKEYFCDREKESEGHTYYVQRTCNEAFTFTPEEGECDKKIVDISIEKILDT